MSEMATMVESIVTEESEVYRAGMAAGYALAKRELTTKARKPRIVADKRLVQDLARAQHSIACLERAMPDSWTTVSDEVFDEGRLSELRRLNRALRDHRLLWAIYRRNDKGKPYFAEAIQ